MTRQEWIKAVSRTTLIIGAIILVNYAVKVDDMALTITMSFFAGWLLRASL